MLFPEKPPHQIHQRGLIVFWNPAGKKVYFDSSRRQGSGCFVEMKLAESSGVPRKDNALRHSFCSYRMATLKNAAQVAYEAGNSIEVIQAHYDKVCTESEGKAWFNLMPETAENVLPMEASA